MPPPPMLIPLPPKQSFQKYSKLRSGFPSKIIIYNQGEIVVMVFNTFISLNFDINL
jgi:hypothetical protein